MAIPSKIDFDHYIHCCEQWSRPIPRPDVNKVLPNRKSIESYVNEYFATALAIVESYQSLVVTKWLEKDQNYRLAMESIFGGPLEEMTDKVIGPLVEGALFALQDMTDAEYAEYLQYKNQQLIDMERQDQFELEEYRRELAESDGRDCYRPILSSKESREAFVNIQPLAYLNSEEGKNRRFRNSLIGLFRTNESLWQWRKHLAECLLEYFYSSPNFEDLSRNKQRQELQYFSEVRQSTVQLLDYLKKDAIESERMELSDEAYVGRTYFQGELLSSYVENAINGPPIIKARRFIRDLEFVLMEIEDKIHHTNRTINSPITRKRDITMPERALVYNLWSFFYSREWRYYFQYRRNVSAFTSLLCLEGISNQLDYRSIDRLISKWESQQ